MPSTIVPTLKRHPTALLTIAGLLLYVLSFEAWLFPWVHNAAIGALLIAFWLMPRRTEIFLLSLVGNLILDPFGHALVAQTPWGALPLRYALTGLLMISWLWDERSTLLSTEQWRQRLHHPMLQWALLWSAVAVYGLLRSLTTEQSTSLILADANAWGFLFVALPASEAAGRPFIRQWLPKVLRASGMALAIATLFWFYFFSHANGFDTAPAVFRWLRDSRLAEVTASLESVRVFIQSQIYLLPMILVLLMRSSFRVTTAISTAIMTAALVLSLSRSFAVGVVGATLFNFLIHTMGTKSNNGHRLTAITQRLAVVALIGSALLFLLNRLPFPPSPTAVTFQSTVSDRLESNESISSRWQQLPSLSRAIREHPLIGWGFGKTATYQSSDPRVREHNPQGFYTTHAFEWGYLDFWLKFGFIGMIILVGSLVWLFYRWYRQARSLVARSWIIGLLTLMIVHVFTPYLNHPLGIGLVIITGMLVDQNSLIETKNVNTIFHARA